jgi:hypothetical protein
MGKEKTVDKLPTDAAAAKPLSVQIVDAIMDGASAIAKVALRAGIDTADKAVNKTRDLVAAVEKKVEAAARPSAVKAIAVAKKPVANQPAAKKTAAKKAPPNSPPAKKTAAKKAAKKTAKKPSARATPKRAKGK